MTKLDKNQPWEPVELPNASDVIYQMLRARILRLEFVPGERLDLPQIEKQLKVSRTPLKDALMKLAAEGLIEIQPRRGTFITTITASKLDECFKIRSAFELYVALCLFKYLTPDDMAFFRDIRRQMNELAHAPDEDWHSLIPEYMTLDRQLHERFIERGGTPRMMQMYQQVNVHMQVTLIGDRYRRQDFDATHFEHEQLFDALESRSTDRLSAALFNHLEGARLRSLKNMRADSGQDNHE